MKLKRVQIGLLAFLFIFIYTHKSIACSCVDLPPPNIAFQSATAVFMGVVDTITVETVYGFPRLKVIFTVDKSWKGLIGQTTFVLTATSSAACGYEFNKGSKYLVYCSGTNDSLRTSLCSRTRKDVEANEDLAYLTTLDVKEISLGAAIPEELLLLQNYPNPANPSTVFRFDIPKSTNIALHLYNMLGQNTAEIFSGYVHEGRKEINWNGSKIPSGLYIVRLQTPYGAKSIKTLFIK